MTTFRRFKSQQAIGWYVLWAEITTRNSTRKDSLEMGEAYYSLTSEGRKAKKGYAKYVRNRKFWQYIDKANKVSTLVKFLYGAGGFIAGWLAKALANVLGM